MKFILIISLGVLLTLFQINRANGGASWKRLAKNVCFGTRNNQFGSLRYYGHNCLVGALKLVHTRGFVRCKNRNKYYSRWGCRTIQIAGKTNVLNVVITDEMNHLIFPKQESIVQSRGLWYILPGVHEFSSRELVFTNFATPFYLHKFMYLRVWYGEDLKGWTEVDNHGRACVDVYARFI